MGNYKGVGNYKPEGSLTLSTQEDVITADDTTTSTTYVTTSLSITKANRSGGRCIAICTANIATNTNQVSIVLYDNGAALAGDVSNNVQSITPAAMSADVPLDGNVIDVRLKSITSGTSELKYTSNQWESKLVLTELS